LRAFVSGDGAYQTVPIGRCAEHVPKSPPVLWDRRDPCHGGTEARLAHLDGIDDRKCRLLLQRRSAAVPELRRVVERVQNRGRIALAPAAPDARRDRLAVSEGARRVMAGAAGYRTVGRQPRVEKQTLAERDLCRCRQVIRRNCRTRCG